MELTLKLLGLTIAPIFGFLGLFGWSHQNLSKRISDMEHQMSKIVPEPKVRQLIDDKMAPVQVEYRAIHHRMDELRTHNKLLEEKMEKVLDILREERRS